jgi:hydrogenase expression/formation protein HypD
MEEVFEPTDGLWRGLGSLPQSGLKLRGKYRTHAAESHYDLTVPPTDEMPGCRCGEVLRGVLAPPQWVLAWFQLKVPVRRILNTTQSRGF